MIATFGMSLLAVVLWQASPSPDAATPSQAAFGQVKERVVPFGAPCMQKYFQFHTGNVFEIGDGPGDESDHAEEYRRADLTGGLDFSVLGGKDHIQLAGKGCLFTSDKTPNWDTQTAEQTDGSIAIEPRKRFAAPGQGNAASPQRDAESNRLIGISSELLIEQYGAAQLHANAEGPDNIVGHFYTKIRPGRPLIIRGRTNSDFVLDAYWCDSGKELAAWRNPPPATDLPSTPGDPPTTPAADKKESRN